MERITLRKPFDAHLHLRDDDILRAVLPYASEHFWGGIIMPNLVPPVATMADARAYYSRIKSALHGADYTPLMTLYLTDTTNPDDVAKAYEDHVVVAAKLYPLHGTTNSAYAVSDYAKIAPTLKMMEQLGMPLLIHGERPTERGQPVDHYDREALFIQSELNELLEAFPDLRVSLEHISSLEAAAFIRTYGHPGLVATITPQHLAIDRRHAINNNDAACMPIIKRQAHREALLDLVASGCEWVHLGTDGAPHIEGKKQAVQCACGCFTGPHAMSLYLEAFEEAGALAHFEAFASLRGPMFFDREPSGALVTYERHEWQIGSMISVGEEPGEVIRPFLFRTPEEVQQGLGKNRVLQWQLAA